MTTAGVKESCLLLAAEILRLHGMLDEERKKLPSVMAAAAFTREVAFAEGKRAVLADEWDDYEALQRHVTLMQLQYRSQLAPPPSVAQMMIILERAPGTDPSDIPRALEEAWKNSGVEGTLRIVSSSTKPS